MARQSRRYLEDLAAEWEPRLKSAFLAANADITNRVNVSAVTRLLEQLRIEDAIRAVGLDPADFLLLDANLTAAYNASGVATAKGIPARLQEDGYRLQVRFDTRNIAAERIIRDRSVALVTEVVDNQIAMMRTHLVTGLQQGRNPKSVALDLVGRIGRATNQRVGGVIGLHSSQERWLANYASDLGSSDPATLRKLLDRGLRDKRFDRSVAKAIREGTAIPAELQAKMRTSYANRALKWRGDNIARTETLSALNQAQHQAYVQAVDKGAVGREEISRFWVTAGDHRVRQAHREIPGLNPEGVGLDEMFITPEGPTLSPPLGPQCRCRVRYEIDHIGRGVRALRGAA